MSDTGPAPDATEDAEDLTREVYARFGLAYYVTECIYRGLVNIFATFPYTPQTATRPRIEERMKVAEEMTLGKLVTATQEYLPAELRAELAWVLDTRNYLAHGFWYDRIHMMLEDERKQELANTLMELVSRMRRAEDRLDMLTFAHMRRIGISEEQFATAMVEASTGPVEPIPDRRIPRTEQRIEIVSAWVVEGAGSMGALVMRDASGEMWQLCDVGLGWSYHREPGEAWKPAAKLARLLPAKIVARPKGARPWNYKLHISTGGFVCVERKDDQGTYSWRIDLGDTRR